MKKSKIIVPLLVAAVVGGGLFAAYTLSSTADANPYVDTVVNNSETGVITFTRTYDTGWSHGNDIYSAGIPIGRYYAESDTQNPYFDVTEKEIQLHGFPREIREEYLTVRAPETTDEEFASEFNSVWQREIAPNFYKWFQFYHDGEPSSLFNGESGYLVIYDSEEIRDNELDGNSSDGIDMLLYFPKTDTIIWQTIPFTLIPNGATEPIVPFEYPEGLNPSIVPKEALYFAE
jgi:hypothetical protein